MKALQLLIFLSALFTWVDSTFAKDQPSRSTEFLNSAAHLQSDLPFSQAVRVGDVLFLSGQIGYDYEQKLLVKGGIKAETKQTMNNIKDVLAANGYKMSQLVKCTVMLDDIAEWQAFNEVYVTYFEKPFPARSAFGADGLALGAKVEVECIAAIGNRQ